MWDVVKKAKPYVAMVSLQFGYAGSYIIAAISLKHGTSHFVLVVYRLAFATATVTPFAIVLDRKSRPKMTFPIFFRIMMLGLVEPVIDLNIYYMGLAYTSPTFTSALYNAMPAITFLMAIILRLEKLKIKRFHSQAKIAGTLIMIGGSMIMTLYKGPILEFVGNRRQAHHGSSEGSGEKDWVKGTVLLIGSCFCWSGFFVMQSMTLKVYPAELSLTALICGAGLVQGSIVALVMERKASAWAIGWDTRLLTPAYLGIICTGISYYVQGVVMKEKGPVFVTAFNPLTMIITAVTGTYILAEKFYLGSVIGAIVIVIGLYSYVWGKSKDPAAKLSSGDEKIGAAELPTTASNFPANSPQETPAKDLLSQK
ncbi:hypothetical protein AAC387_Pa01g0299 [Persea americana]